MSITKLSKLCQLAVTESNTLFTSPDKIHWLLHPVTDKYVFNLTCLDDLESRVFEIRQIGEHFLKMASGIFLFVCNQIRNYVIVFQQDLNYDFDCINRFLLKLQSMSDGSEMPVQVQRSERYQDSV